MHESQRHIICELLDFVWDEAADVSEAGRVDMRLALTQDQLTAVSLSTLPFISNTMLKAVRNQSLISLSEILCQLDSSLDDKCG